MLPDGWDSVAGSASGAWQHLVGSDWSASSLSRLVSGAASLRQHLEYPRAILGALFSFQVTFIKLLLRTFSYTAISAVNLAYECTVFATVLSTLLDSEEHFEVGGVGS